jgi:hypothetical protein
MPGAPEAFSPNRDLRVYDSNGRCDELDERMVNAEFGVWNALDRPLFRNPQSTICTSKMLAFSRRFVILKRALGLASRVPEFSRVPVFRAA